MPDQPARARLADLLGEWVTVTNPLLPASWCGRLLGLADEPSLLIEEARGRRMCLPQVFTVEPAEPPAAAPQQTGRISINDLTSNQLDALYAELDRLAAELEELRQIVAAPVSDAGGIEFGRALVGKVRELIDERRHYRIAAEAIARVRALHDRLADSDALTDPDDLITRRAAAERIATALDGAVTPLRGAPKVP